MTMYPPAWIPTAPPSPSFYSLSSVASSCASAASPPLGHCASPQPYKRSASVNEERPYLPLLRREQNLDVYRAKRLVQCSWTRRRRSVLDLQWLRPSPPFSMDSLVDEGMPNDDLAIAFVHLSSDSVHTPGPFNSSILAPFPRSQKLVRSFCQTGFDGRRCV